MRYNTTTKNERPWLVIMVAAVLLINTIVLGRSLNLYTLPGERGELALVKESASLVASQMLQIGISEQRKPIANAIEDSLAQLQYEISRARTVDEVAVTLQKGILEAQSVIPRDEDAARRDAILSVLGKNDRILDYQGKTSITINREDGQDLSIVDTAQLITQTVRAELARHVDLQQPFMLVVEVDSGKVRLPTQRTISDRLAGLEQEIASLRVELQSVRIQKGFSPMSGAGVRVRLYDAFGGFTEDKIVHDLDVRDVINELSAAGAAGIAVGEQRIVATSSVRCAGPVILVNHRPVQVDPITIFAVGDPDILASSLNLLSSTLMATKGVTLEVEKQERLTLPAHAPLN